MSGCVEGVISILEATKSFCLNQNFVEVFRKFDRLCLDFFHNKDRFSNACAKIALIDLSSKQLVTADKANSLNW